MSEVEKHCDTCEHSYRPTEQYPCASSRGKTQYCVSIDYNADDYTHELLLEDWDKGYCRFWTPKKERTK